MTRLATQTEQNAAERAEATPPAAAPPADENEVDLSSEDLDASLGLNGMVPQPVPAKPAPKAAPPEKAKANKIAPPKAAAPPPAKLRAKGGLPSKKAAPQPLPGRSAQGKAATALLDAPDPPAKRAPQAPAPKPQPVPPPTPQGTRPSPAALPSRKLPASSGDSLEIDWKKWAIIAVPVLVVVVGVYCFFTMVKATVPLTPVEGVVSLDGKPLAGATVEFVPEVEPGSKRLPFSRGVTDEQGHFTLDCENKQPGAVIGSHKVVVRYLQRKRDSTESRPVIPQIYQALADTPLQVEVRADQSVYHLSLNQP